MKTFLVLAVVAVIAACSWDKPLSVAPQAGYPCGVTGVVCGGGMCCEENEVCGGGAFAGCPAGQCCYIGPEELGASRDGGSSRMHPQRSAH